MQSYVPHPWEQIAHILDQVIRNMESTSTEPKRIHSFNKKLAHLTRFSASKAPSISLYDYVNRIQTYSKCSPSCFTLAFIYLDRVMQNNQWLTLGYSNVHRLILVSIVIAIKYNDDAYFDNLYYSKIGGLPLDEFNRLETEFLHLIRFGLYVSTELFERYVSDLKVNCLQLINAKPQEKMIISDPSCAKSVPQAPSDSSIKTVPSSPDICESTSK